MFNPYYGLVAYGEENPDPSGAMAYAPHARLPNMQQAMVMTPGYFPGQVHPAWMAYYDPFLSSRENPYLQQDFGGMSQYLLAQQWLLSQQAQMQSHNLAAAREYYRMPEEAFEHPSAQISGQNQPFRTNTNEFLQVPYPAVVQRSSNESSIPHEIDECPQNEVEECQFEYGDLTSYSGPVARNFADNNRQSSKRSRERSMSPTKRSSDGLKKSKSSRRSGSRQPVASKAKERVADDKVKSQRDRSATSLSESARSRPPSGKRSSATSQYMQRNPQPSTRRRRAQGFREADSVWLSSSSDSDDDSSNRSNSSGEKTGRYSREDSRTILATVYMNGTRLTEGCDATGALGREMELLSMVNTTNSTSSRASAARSAASDPEGHAGTISMSQTHVSHKQCSRVGAQYQAVIPEYCAISSSDSSREDYNIPSVQSLIPMKKCSDDCVEVVSEVSLQKMPVEEVWTLLLGAELVKKVLQRNESNLFKPAFANCFSIAPSFEDLLGCKQEGEAAVESCLQRYGIFRNLLTKFIRVERGTIYFRSPCNTTTYVVASRDALYVDASLMKKSRSYRPHQDASWDNMADNMNTLRGHAIFMIEDFVLYDASDGQRAFESDFSFVLQDEDNGSDCALGCGCEVIVRGHWIVHSEALSRVVESKSTYIFGEKEALLVADLESIPLTELLSASLPVGAYVVTLEQTRFSQATRPLSVAPQRARRPKERDPSDGVSYTLRLMASGSQLSTRREYDTRACRSLSSRSGNDEGRKWLPLKCPESLRMLPTQFLAESWKRRNEMIYARDKGIHLKDSLYVRRAYLHSRCRIIPLVPNMRRDN